MRFAIRQALRVAATGMAFAGFFLGGAVLGWIALPLVALSTRSADVRARRCRALVRRSWVFFHDYMRIARVILYDPRKVRVSLPDGPFVVVANHPTLVDVTAICAALPDLSLVAKTSMYRTPILGRLLRLCGFVEADERSIFSGAEAAARCLAQLQAGIPVLIFPEGTRSPAYGLGPFHPGAFQIAARAGVPVVPLLVRCDPPTLLRGDAWYDVPPSTAIMTVEMLSMPLADPDDPDALARRLREVYVQRLGCASTPTGTPLGDHAPGRTSAAG
jgi:1-acyl-sn-glycerol-3-phosphate acyltransferase